MDRLEGDSFSTQEWINARIENKKDERNIEDLPGEIQEQVRKLMVMCAESNIPMFAAFSITDKVKMFSDIGDTPENCHFNFILARSTASCQAAYMQQLVMNPAFLAHIPRKEMP